MEYEVADITPLRPKLDAKLAREKYTPENIRPLLVNSLGQVTRHRWTGLRRDDGSMVQMFQCQETGLIRAWGRVAIE